MLVSLKWFICSRRRPCTAVKTLALKEMIGSIQIYKKKNLSKEAIRWKLGTNKLKLNAHICNKNNQLTLEHSPEHNLKHNINIKEYKLEGQSFRGPLLEYGREFP